MIRYNLARKRSYFVIIAGLLMGLCAFVRADTTPATQLQTQIDATNASITNLENEISQYQSQLNAASMQANSLSNTLTQLDLSKKKLDASILLTKDQIAQTNSQIARLSVSVTAKQNNINQDETIIGKSLQTIRQMSDTSLIELLLGQKSISSAAVAIDNLASVQSDVRDQINTLVKNKTALQNTVVQTQQKKAHLSALQASLTDQEELIVVSENEKAALLAQTKNTQANYAKIIADKKAQEASFEQDVIQYEASLHLTVNSNELPPTGTGVLNWPLDSVHVTQFFGNTDFATKNPQIYNGKGHTGVDFRAAIGTPIKAALNGVVVGVGNTDLEAGCYSYGKWIMIKHPDGLSTLYAHLSLPLVTQGQTVSTGDLIGYSGQTGYATGPHLHFGVYATQGVVIAKYTSSAHCHNVVIPLADISAYLNPLSYLPALP